MKHNFPLTIALLALVLTPVAGFAADTAATRMAAPTAEKAAPDAPVSTPAATVATSKAFFVDLKDGATISSPATIKFGVAGVEIAPAGSDKPHTGHFHLLIDTDLTAAQQKVAMPSDANHIHYGKGQTEGTVSLTPGKHTLQLVVADSKHVPLDPPVQSEKITVTVK